MSNGVHWTFAYRDGIRLTPMMERQLQDLTAIQRPNQRARRIILAAACALGIGIFIVAGPYWPDEGFVHEGIELIGVGLITICVLGRAWCILRVGNRKNLEMAEDGPYSVVRHPMYVFAIIGAFGMGAQAGGVTAALVSGFVTWTILSMLSESDDENLVEIFGARYFHYMMRVPAFIPNFSLYRRSSSLTFGPRQLVVVCLDAMIFFASIPVMEMFDHLHDSGALPTLLWLP